MQSYLLTTFICSLLLLEEELVKWPKLCLLSAFWKDRVTNVNAYWVNVLYFPREELYDLELKMLKGATHDFFFPWNSFLPASFSPHGKSGAVPVIVLTQQVTDGANFYKHGPVFLLGQH